MNEQDRKKEERLDASRIAAVQDERARQYASLYACLSDYGVVAGCESDPVQL